jgi:MtfA peptidase
MVPENFPDIIFTVLLFLLLGLRSGPGKKIFYTLFVKPFEKFLNSDFKLLSRDVKKINPEDIPPASTRNFNKIHSSVITHLPYLVYEGRSLNFTKDELIYILNKRNIFYVKLSAPHQQLFLERLQHFIHDKLFVIHDEKGFKEMPVLIAGTAVQLTFGLKKYILPFFKEIHIYPDAFLGISPLRVLIGNVSGNAISISWKHFLQGVAVADDNNHLGLHEMAHALYYQNMVVKNYADEDFARAFLKATKVFEVVLALEKNMEGMYSAYASKNFQEFWAESIEIFFENPKKLKTLYPHLFDAVCGILNLNPLNHNNPVLS